MIIYDELHYSKHLLETKVKRIYQYDLNYLAKYWTFEGFKKSKIEENLLNWCLKQDENFNVIHNRKRIRKAIQHANRIGFRSLIPIAVTQHELEVIKSIDDYRLEKIVFIMLITARYFKYTDTRKNPKNTAKLIGTYYNHPFIAAMKIAGVAMNIQERNESKNRLKILGLIEPILFTNNPYKQEVSYRLNFSDDTGFPVIKIEDWRNPIVYYQEYKGEKIIHCEECGMMILKRGKNHCFCRRCWKKRENKIKRDWDRKNRNAEVFDKDSCDYS